MNQKIIENEQVGATPHTLDDANKTSLKLSTDDKSTSSNSSNVYHYTPPSQSPPKKNRSPWRIISIILSITLTILAPVFLCILPVILFSSISYIASSGLQVNKTLNIQESNIYNFGDQKSNQKLKIAVININGGISYELPGSTTNTTTSNSTVIIEQLNKAQNDETVKAVLLRWNSPGGELSAAEPICAKIKEVSETKSVYSFIDTTGASLAYLLPNCGDEIFARESAITGSIGVIIQAIDLYGVIENIGGKVVFVTNSNGDLKTGEDIFVEDSETYKLYQAILDEGYEYFVEVILDGRKNKTDITREELLSYADGRVFTGKQALANGLVDFNSEFPETLEKIISLERLENKAVEVVEYILPLANPFGQLLGASVNFLQSSTMENKVEQTAQIKVMAVLRY